MNVNLGRETQGVSLLIVPVPRHENRFKNCPRVPRPVNDRSELSPVGQVREDELAQVRFHYIFSDVDSLMVTICKLIWKDWTCLNKLKDSHCPERRRKVYKHSGAVDRCCQFQSPCDQFIAEMYTGSEQWWPCFNLQNLTRHWLSQRRLQMVSYKILASRWPRGRVHMYVVNINCLSS
jgi:hypothetical protein